MIIMEQLARLTEIANRLGTDKGTLEHIWGHGYTETYAKLFDPLVDKPVKMMEIGICDPRFPGASLKMWEEYFGASLELIGYDINPQARDFANIFTHIFIGDQNNPRDLILCLDIHGKGYDIIIDDGSHVGEHICNSFQNLFPSVKPGGYYIIEDLHSAYTHADVTLPALQQIIVNFGFRIISMDFSHGGKLLVIKKEASL
jgi:hypothetical protein